MTQFIYHEKLIAGQQLLKVQQVLVIASLHQLADERNPRRCRTSAGERVLGGPPRARCGRSQAHAMTALAGTQAESQLQDQLFAERWNCQELEAVEALDHGELRLADPVLLQFGIVVDAAVRDRAVSAVRPPGQRFLSARGGFANEVVSK